jgi:hypothetical protein
MLDIDNYLEHRAAASAAADIKQAREYGEQTAAALLAQFASRPVPQPISTPKPS